MFDVVHSPLPGCVELRPTAARDARGLFAKTFHEGFFREHGLAAHFAEQFYTVSRRGVLRGLHFQLPPADHEKLVCCVGGKVIDAVVDLRAGSPGYGRHAVFELDGEAGNAVYIPKGLAHGFYVLSEAATMVYSVTSAHAPALDAGILWNSAGIPWPDAAPVVSRRDAGFAPLDRFVSPFRYSATA